jgi:HlyD family secretion protein
LQSVKPVNRGPILVVALIAAGFAGWWFYLRPQTPQPIEWQGYADADFVKVGPTQQGLVTEIHVRRGDRVTKGAPLFDQDDTNDEAALDQAGRQLSQAQEQLANLKSGGKPTEIAQAEANLTDAEASRDKTKADLARNQSLLKTGAASAQVVDQEMADARSGDAKVAAQQALLAQLRAPMGRPDEIKAQEAAVKALQAAHDMARWRRDQRHVVSPVSGVVADTLAEPGETLAAGAPVVSILPPENIFVRFFVPEPDLAKVHEGDEVALSCDSCRTDLSATISYIAPQAEYTPPVIYSESTRAKFVFLVEARPKPEEATLLNPGQPVTVRPLPATVPTASR